MTELEQSAEKYADEQLFWADESFAASGYDRYVKMKTILFNGNDLESAFIKGAEYMKQQILQLLDDRMTSNLANEGNSAGGRYYSAKMEEDNDIITEIKKL